MGELVNAEFQREILQTLSGSYPVSVDPRKIWGGQADNRLSVNLHYLSEFKLVELRSFDPMSGGPIIVGARITAKGLDYIAKDGGLGAVLDVVTIKLHEDTIKELLISKVNAAKGDQSIKDSLIGKIKAMPAQALGKISERAIELGLERAPDLVEWLGDAIANTAG